MSETSQTEAILPRWLVIGFSGHRHLDGREQTTAEAIRAKVDALAAQHPRVAGVCSAAGGADTLFAEEMLDRGVPLSIVLPFDARRFERDFKGQAADVWQRAKRVIRLGKVVDVVHQYEADLASVREEDASPAEQKAAAAARDEQAYWECTVRTVDRADALLAVWDGEAGRGHGGTADAVKYADARGIPVIVYNPETGVFSRDDSARLSPDTVPGELDTSDPKKLVDDQLDYYDRLADLHRPPSQSLMQWCVYLHLAASAGAAFAILFVKTRYWALIPASVEVVALASVYMLLRMRGNHHHLWFISRVRAEIYRTFQCTWDIRRHPSLVHQPRRAIADHFDAGHDGARRRWRPERLWSVWRGAPGAATEPALPESTAGADHLFRSLRFLRELDATPVPGLEAAREAYIDRRLTGKHGQITYFTGKLDSSRRVYNAYTRRGAFASLAAATSAVAVLLMLLFAHEHELLTHVFEYLGVVMPLFATAFTFLMVSSDASRRVHRYDQMIRTLNRLLPVVAAAPTREALSRAATQVEEELIQEFVEWQSFVHYTEHLH